MMAAPAVTHTGNVTTIVQQDAAAPLVHVDYVVRAGLDRQQLTQNGLAALTAETILRTPVNGVPLETAVAAAGGSVSFTVDPSDVRFDVEALPEDGAKVFGLFRSAVVNPRLDPATVREARSRLIGRIAENQQIALQVGIDMLDATLAASANEGLPQFGIPASLAQLGPDDVKAFHNQFYMSGGLYVSAVGRVDALGAGVLDGLARALPVGSTKPISVMLPKLEGSTHHLVAERPIASPWLIAQYPAPAIGSKDFGPMLVLSGFMQRTLSDMVQMPGVVSPTFASHAIGAVYQFEGHQPSLVLYVNGGIGDPNRTFLTALSVASILSSTKLEGSIDDFKTLAQGNFLTSTATLQTRAWLAVLFDENGAQPDYINRTLTAIAQTNASDLQRVARAYLGNPTIALVVPRDNT
jgi:predicted Zn-dependent peptidase